MALKAGLLACLIFEFFFRGSEDPDCECDSRNQKRTLSGFERDFEFYLLPNSENYPLALVNMNRYAVEPATEFIFKWNSVEN